MADITFGNPAARKPGKVNSFRVIVYAVVTLAAFIYIAPFVWMTAKSFQTQLEAGSTKLLPANVQWQNYTDVWNGSEEISRSRKFGQYLANTLKIEALTIVLQTTISILAAYAFAKMRFPGRNFMFAMLLTTLFVPSIILIVPNLVIVTRISQAFEAINPALKWMNNWPVLVIPFLSNTFSIFLLRQFFLQIPDELWDAARIDGAGHLRYLWRVVVPISRAPIATTILFTFIAVWSAFEWPLLVLQGNPEWTPISLALSQFRGDGGERTHLLMAAAVVALMPIMILYFFTQKQFTQGITTTGLK
ncbi:MAG TPA: carbohydrate ABC transporter permease [Aggregatilineales bacterium]|nr:carbohydrate ABC transporter permease [Anaerolineales bacterium]HRE48469.1 carbohydrate ABC transporter permease [Aggregatilineales bacterium]